MPRSGRLSAKSLSREVLYARRCVEDAFRWSGTQMAVRRVWVLEDFEEGRVGHCPRCWDPMVKQVRDSRCPVCYGTGYEGGYRPFEVVWCSILENQPMTEQKREAAGDRNVQGTSIKLPGGMMFHNGDVFAEVRGQEDGRVTEIGRMFVLGSPVQRKTIQGRVSNNCTEGYRVTRVEDMVVSQEGPLTLILPSDLRYRMGLDFMNGVMPQAGEAEGQPVSKSALDQLLDAEATRFPSGNMKVPDSSHRWLQ